MIVTELFMNDIIVHLSNLRSRLLVVKVGGGESLSHINTGICLQ
jgi:hypothetical protein